MVWVRSHHDIIGIVHCPFLPFSHLGELTLRDPPYVEQKSQMSLAYCVADISNAIEQLRNRVEGMTED